MLSTSQMIQYEMGLCQPYPRSEVKTTVLPPQLMMKQNKITPPLHFTTTYMFKHIFLALRSSKVFDKKFCHEEHHCINLIK